MRKSLLYSIAFALLASSGGRADVLLPLVVNTTSTAGTSGYVDFQFNPLNSSTLPETATVTNFTGAAYNSTLGVTLTGAASGGPIGITNLVLNNSTSYNDAFEGTIYGKSISFVLDLSGAGITNPKGSLSTAEFDFSLFDSNQNPILTSNPNGYALTVDVNSNGSITVIPQSPNVTFLPEPSSLALLGVSVFGFAAAKLLRRRASA